MSRATRDRRGRGGRARARRGALTGAAVAIGLAWAAAAAGYQVRLDTSGWTGRSALITFDLTSSKALSALPAAPSVDVFEFSHDGRYGTHETRGGLVSGDIIEAQNPASWTVLSGLAPDDSMFFFTELGVRLDSLGTRIAFGLTMTALTVFDTGLWDRLAFFVRRGDGAPAFATADPTGGHALFTLDATSTAGEVLHVYAPMVFIPPDTLALGMPVAGAPVPSATGAGLRLRGVWPNPAVHGVEFEFEVPAPGGVVAIEVFDLVGRRMREVSRGPHPAGDARVRWNGTDAEGRRLPAGVYVARLSMGGEAAVRKIVLSR